MTELVHSRGALGLSAIGLSVAVIELSRGDIHIKILLIVDLRSWYESIAPDLKRKIQERKLAHE